MAIKFHYKSQPNNMDQKTQVLRAFITEALAEHGYTPDETVFLAIEQCVTLTEVEGPEYEEVRSATIKEDSDGKVSAELFSLYNLSRVSFHDLFGLLIEGSIILTMAEDTKLKIGLAVAKMVHSFLPTLTHKLNDQDAKIMLAIYQVKAASFSSEEVAIAYQAQFGQSIDAAQLQRSLEYLVKLNFLRKSGDLYSPRQRMNYERN